MPENQSLFGKSHAVTLPVSELYERIGEVYLCAEEDGTYVQVTFRSNVEDAYGQCQTGLTLDASASMKKAYGKFVKGFSPFHPLHSHMTKQ